MKTKKHLYMTYLPNLSKINKKNITYSLVIITNVTKKQN